MSDSAFDPNEFLDATTTEASIRRPPVPAGTDLVGYIKDVVFRNVQGKKDPSKSYLFMDVQIVASITPELQSQGQPPEVTYTAGVGIDTIDGAGIDFSPGKNGQLRRYREALGMNNPGEPFSPRAMIGKQIRVKVKHEFYNGETYDRVDTVAKV